MTRPLLYVCAPVRTSTPEERAWILDVRVRAFAFGWAPVWGPSLFQGMGLTEERDRAAILESDASLMQACDALVIVGGRLTGGMEYELLRWLPRRVLTPLGLSKPGQCAYLLMESSLSTPEDALATRQDVLEEARLEPLLSCLQK